MYVKNNNVTYFDSFGVEHIPKDSEIQPYSLCLGNISNGWSHYNMKKTGFNGYIYDFTTDYNTISISDILDVHKHLMKKNGII